MRYDNRVPTEEEEEEEEEEEVAVNEMIKRAWIEVQGRRISLQVEIGLFWRHMIPFGCFILALGGQAFAHIALRR